MPPPQPEPDLPMRPTPHRGLHLLLAAGLCALQACGGGEAAMPERATLGAATAHHDTERPLDVTIDGEGWLVLQPAGGDGWTYSRSGRLGLGASGQLVHASGARVVGLADAGATLAQPLPPALTRLAPRATTLLVVQGGLDSRAADGPAATLDSTAVVWRADGRAASLRLQFCRLPAPAAGTGQRWEVQARVDDGPVAARLVLDYPSPGQPAGGAAARLHLAAGDSGLDRPLSVSLAGMVLAADDAGITQQAGDGHPPGGLQAAHLQADGRLVLQYSNGQVRAGGRLLLADPGRAGGPVLGPPGSAGLGLLRGHTLDALPG